MGAYPLYAGKQKTADIVARRAEAAKFGVEVKDVTTPEARLTVGIDHPADPEGAKALIRSTPQRVCVGRNGPRPKLLTYFQMRADHGATQDSLKYSIPEDKLKALNLVNLGETGALGSLETYLRLPPLARKLSDEAKAVLLEKCAKNPTVQIVVSNGLSGYAVERYAGDVLKGLVDGLKSAGIAANPPVYVNRARVGIMNDVGATLNADIVIVLIGERPGLIISDALSIYMGYKPRWEPLTTDANRDNICMISKKGKDPIEAAAEAVGLAKDYLKYKTSGVELATKKRG
ncbi:MAG TPA: ethanolamine ammonia-lyase light chain EutC [Spirochaetales bacterium]|nr:ethanolamine ammonia-lyase light chain EutC [Spirochaetales bacterium]HRY53388.1 ethanolamine ammonia-lyase light chain EutC [Spirochaetia bacterium]HRZ63981.1 ethanolamine ammonia-lyase light chain EutC [Spirochaetia bacterium]